MPRTHLLALLALALTLAAACTSNDATSPTGSPSATTAPRVTAIPRPVFTPIVTPTPTAPPAIEVNPTPAIVVSPKRTPPTPPASEAWPTGVFETAQSPLPSKYRIENQWQRDDGRVRIQAYAGSLASDPEQGILIVLTHNLGSGEQNSDSFMTRERIGPLRVLRSSGTVLTLVSARGELLGFDTDARRFVNAPPLPVWGSGIGALDELPFPAGYPFPVGIFRVQNVWQGRVDGAYVRIFAGSYSAAPEQGVVVIQEILQTLWPISGAVHLGPNTLFEVESITGPVSVHSSTDGLVQLVNSDGHTVAFDVRERAFRE